MMTSRNSRQRSSVDEWLRQQMEEAASYAFPAGLYDLPDEYRNIADAKVRAKAVEVYGERGTAPDTLRERRTELRQRGQELRGKIVDNPIWKENGRSFASDAAKTLPGWRIASVVSLLFALWGLAHRERTWDGWALLLVSATLAVLILPVLPVVVRFGKQIALSFVASLRQVAALLLVQYKQLRIESQARAEEDLRQKLDYWIEEKMGLLLAEYQHNKNIALRARQAA